MIILIGILSSIIVFLIFFWFFSNVSSFPLKNKEKKTLPAVKSSSKAFTISSKDIETVSGDDVITTQLDLARAYLETGRKTLARNILNNVILHGTLEQKKEAEKLIMVLVH